MPKIPDQIFEDKEFGSVFVFFSARVSYGRISFSATKDGLAVKANSATSFSELANAIESLRPKLRVLIKKNLQKEARRVPLEIGSVIEAYPYPIVLKQGEYSDKFVSKINGDENKFEIYCPKNMDFEDEEYLEVLRKSCANVLRAVSKSYMPKRVKELAEKCGFQYKTIGFTDAIGRWGSCSSRGSLNFSIWTLLLGKDLIDSVIIHELCHTVEMNHSAKFWALFEKSFGKSRKSVDDEIKKIVLPKFVQMK
ncbi:MAG: M48 family metallopeptidase [Paludibacteraceae bacterium]|nr:M48 family metallopeptidase [Paludibacteraceae bacterium]